MAENTNTNNANPDTSSAADSAENNEQTNSAENTAQKKYSDDEVNSLVKKNSEKAVQKLMKELGITDKEKAKSILAKAAEEEKKSAPQNGAEDNALASELAEAKHSHELAMLENVFLTSDVQPSKVEKAVRLIDVDKCRDEDGNFDREKAKAEVEALLKEWPELKKTAENSGGFVIGSDGQSDTGGKDAAKSKPAVKQKSWNRWN